MLNNRTGRTTRTRQRPEAHRHLCRMAFALKQIYLISPAHTWSQGSVFRTLCFFTTHLCPISPRALCHRCRESTESVRMALVGDSNRSLVTTIACTSRIEAHNRCRANTHQFFFPHCFLLLTLLNDNSTFFCTYAGYLTGDRFSSEFIMRRCMELQLFLERVCRHPLLQRAKILQQFLESNEWHIDMHTHSGQPIASTSGAPAPEVPSSSTGGILESMSDIFVNAFTRVRKPDPRFIAIKAGLEGEEDRTTQWERVLLRNRTHVSGMFSGSLAWLVGCCIARPFRLCARYR